MLCLGGKCVVCTDGENLDMLSHRKETTLSNMATIAIWCVDTCYHTGHTAVESQSSNCSNLTTNYYTEYTNFSATY